MKGTCNKSECGIYEGLGCDLGFAVPASCKHFSQQVNPPDELSESDSLQGQILPWTGRALGLNDILLISARSSPILVGLIGLFDAGKTAFLTSLFTHFSKSGAVGSFTFAGSFTLQAWSRLKDHTVWPSSHGPCFPPHTPDSPDRVPSLLHIAFRDATGRINDVLFTDAPGEWFNRWMNNQMADNAQGARWIAEHAKHFLFFVDRKALAGPHRGKARNDTQVLARVLSERLDCRQVTAIWAKSDISCAIEAESPVRERLNYFFGEHSSFDLHVEDPRCLRVLELILNSALTERRRLPPLFVPTKSAFLAYGQTDE